MTVRIEYLEYSISHLFTVIFATFESGNLLILARLSALTNISRHNAHWGGLLGFDWMIETPSLIFTEIDDSESLGEYDEIECLFKESDAAEIRSFLYNNKLLTAFPVLQPNSYTQARCAFVEHWEGSRVERSITLDFEEGTRLSAFCTDGWQYAGSYKEDKELHIGLSALPYRLSVSNDAFFWNISEEHDDHSSSYNFSGAELYDIESGECFYHIGWFASLRFPEKPNFPPIRIWIHKKNIDSPPKEGQMYGGSLWLQCALSDK